MNTNLFRSLKTLSVALMVTVAGVVSAAEPSDVRNVTAEGLDGAVRLTWDEATDDGLVVGYKVHYGVTTVTEEGDTYDQEVNTFSEESSFDVENLINNNTYFFAVTAVDDEGLESELYSVEVSATPKSSGGDGAPILISATHTAANKVLLIMSEPVQLDDPTTAFDLSDTFTEVKVPILNTLINSQQLTLVLDPASLTPGRKYTLTATTGVTDFDGNPVSSGVVDSVEFDAVGEFETPVVEPPASDDEEDNDEDEEEFEEELLIEEEPVIETPAEPNDLNTFFLDDSQGNSDTANFLDSLLSPDNPINNLERFEPEAETTTETSTPSVPTANETQNLSSAPDQVPPQDARNLLADTSMAPSGQVQISWTPAVDIDGDIKDQVLYTRVGLGVWDTGISLGKGVSNATINVDQNENYQIRLVTLDEANNESFGAAFEFSTTLNQSGGGQGSVVALTVLAALGFFFLFVGGRKA